MKYLNDYYYQLKNENIDEKERAIKKEIAYILYYEEQEAFNNVFNCDFNKIDFSTDIYRMTIINENNQIKNKQEVKKEILKLIKHNYNFKFKNLQDENIKLKQMIQLMQSNNNVASLTEIERPISKICPSMTEEEIERWISNFSNFSLFNDSSQFDIKEIEVKNLVLENIKMDNDIIKNQINFVSLQNQPSTSGYKQIYEETENSLRLIYK